MREDSAGMVSLVNEGARELGYADAGALWRSGYDMAPEEFEALSDRLRLEVKLFYEQLHCCGPPMPLVAAGTSALNRNIKDLYEA